MEEKSINISIPEGYEIDKNKSTFTKIVFKKIESKLPMSFDAMPIPEYWGVYNTITSKHKNNGNYIGACFGMPIYSTKEYAEAFYALSKLIWLRDAWNKGWIPDYNDGSQAKYTIVCYNNKVSADIYYKTNKVMNFKTYRIRDNFLIQFEDLLEIAKPLL